MKAVDAALADLDVKGAWAGLKAGEEALLACDVRIRPEQYGDLWIREGVVESLRGNEDASDDAFAAGGRVAPEGWRAQYGDVLKARFDLLQIRRKLPARLRLLPPPGGNRVWIDGSEVEVADPSRIDVVSGLHGVQLLSPDGAVQFSQILWIAPDDTATVETGVAPAPVPEPAPMPIPVEPKKPRKRIDPLLVGGIAGVVAGGTLLAVSFERSAAMDDAGTPEALKSAYDLHVGTRIGGLGLLGLGVAGVGVSFAL
jgi:hypothetical protein